MRYEGSTFLILRRMTMGAHDDPKLYDQRLESYLPTEATCALLQQILKSPDRLRKLLFKSIVSLNLICETPWRLKPTSFSICFLLDLSQSIRFAHPSYKCLSEPDLDAESVPPPISFDEDRTLSANAQVSRGVAWLGRRKNARRERLCLSSPTSWRGWRATASSRKSPGRSACAGFRWCRRRSRRAWRRETAGRSDSR